MTKPQNPDFRDILYELSVAGVDCLIVGAHAVMVYTEPRYTKDLDVFVRATPGTAPKILAALRRFGAPTQELTEADFSQPGITFQMGLPPNRIDIITEIDGVTFDEAWSDCRDLQYADVSTHVASPNCLIRNKSACGRPQDLIDVEKLKKAASLKINR